jgi:hypothetical protein
MGEAGKRMPHAHPLSVYLPSRTKSQCALQLSVNSQYITLYVLYGIQYIYSTYSHRKREGRRGELTREKVRVAVVNKVGRKNQHD